MKIVWFSWKDIKHPDAGGAERVTHELAKRLAHDGHQVVLITSRPKGLKQSENLDDYTIERCGSKFSVYLKAYQNFKRNHSTKTDIIIEEVNTIPFFTQFYAKKQRRYLFMHQLAREIWFYQMIFPLSLVGYLLEPVYLWILRNNSAITVSNSSRNDLIRYGFDANKIAIISEGISIKPVKPMAKIKKYPELTVLSIGAIRPMKRTLHQIKAFEFAKTQIPQLKLKIAGDSKGNYGKKVLRYVQNSPYCNDISYLGKVDDKQKIKLLQKCHALLCTSVKEGWGLVVTEAASQGTPAVAYNVDGFQDSIKNGITGVISKHNTPESLSESLVNMLENQTSYGKIKEAAYSWSKTITFNQAYKDFKKAINLQ